MQTLYQYRTYSIDSSEESSGECYFYTIVWSAIANSYVTWSVRICVKSVSSNQIEPHQRKGDDEGEKGQQQRQQRLELLDRLAAEKKQLEQRKLEMQVKNQMRIVQFHFLILNACRQDCMRSELLASN